MSCRAIALIFLAALAALACGRPVPHSVPVEPPASAPAPAPPPASPPPSSSEGACSSLKELACIDSADCTLAVAEGSREYFCRDAEGPCETGFRQRGDGADACEAKPGCRFVPGRCYCSPDVTCICGGGPPPQCVEP
jgi:hypothetical protein